MIEKKLIEKNKELNLIIKEITEKEMLIITIEEKTKYKLFL